MSIIGLKAFLGTIWEWVTWGGSKLWSSVAALVASPAVWTACSAIFVAGFCLGHWERGIVVKKMRGEKVEITKELAAVSDRLKGTLQALAEAKAAYDAEKAKHQPAATVAPATEPPVTKARKSYK